MFNIDANFITKIACQASGGAARLSFGTRAEVELVAPYTPDYTQEEALEHTTMSVSRPPTRSGSGSGYRFGYSKATTASHSSRTIHSDASFVMPHMKPYFKVLDVGCGPGTITIGFASLVDPCQGGSVTGVDVGEPVLQSARQVADSESQGQPSWKDMLTFQQANVLEGLPFADGTFDVVFTSQTLSHLAPVPDAPVAALKEMRRVLKEGGFLAARDAASLTYQPYRVELQRCLVDRMYKVINGTGDPCGIHMAEYLRKAGWDMHKAQMGGGTTIYTGREQCQWWRDTMGGRLAKGDAFRENWVRAGISEDECDETRELMDRWAESEDAWYGVLQSEVLAWK